VTRHGNGGFAAGDAGGRFGPQCALARRRLPKKACGKPLKYVMKISFSLVTPLHARAGMLPA
jgi:hypothetical protein